MEKQTSETGSTLTPIPVIHEYWITSELKLSCLFFSDETNEHEDIAVETL
ncbi:hypothetical protein [uncultured Bacteroides sp.]|nr:hypothetical protein [uncultured Bacteroides sp.]